jgi:hypothetical protein
MVESIQEWTSEIKSRTEDWSCLIDKHCRQSCKRRDRWKSPNWFSGWVAGVPDGKCYFRQEDVSLTMRLLEEL